MQTTLSNQIKAIQVAKGILDKLKDDSTLSFKIGDFETALIKELDVALNDAGATISILNAYYAKYRDAYGNDAVGVASDFFQILHSTYFK